VKTKTGQPIGLKVAPSDTIDQVKQKIQIKRSISSDKQHLIFTGRKLHNWLTLSYYNIKEEVTLHLECKLMIIYVKIEAEKTVKLE